jgi:hypothetical protein
LIKSQRATGFSVATTSTNPAGRDNRRHLWEKLSSRCLGLGGRSAALVIEPPSLLAKLFAQNSFLFPKGG